MLTDTILRSIQIFRLINNEEFKIAFGDLGESVHVLLTNNTWLKKGLPVHFHLMKRKQKLCFIVPLTMMPCRLLLVCAKTILLVTIFSRSTSGSNSSARPDV
jgi:hypothetical protein